MTKKMISAFVIISSVIAIFMNSEKLSFHNQIESHYKNAADAARCVLLYDLDTETIIFSKNTDMKIKIGSITKLLSIIVADPYFKSDDLIHVGAEVDYNVAEDASRSMIRNGQIIDYYQLLTAIMLPSGCDATMTMVVNAVKRMTRNENLSDEECIKKFCFAMNLKAAEIGCKNSFFVNPDGQDADEEYTCVSDVFLIVREIMKNKHVMEISDMCSAEVKLASGEIYKWENTNKMINPKDVSYYEYAHGIKTGYTIKGGYSLVSTAEKDGRHLLAIVCGCSSERSRYSVASNLFKLFFIDCEYNK